MFFYGLIGFWLGGFVVTFAGTIASRNAGMAGLTSVPMWRLFFFSVMWMVQLPISFWTLKGKINTMRAANSIRQGRGRVMRHLH